MIAGRFPRNDDQINGTDLLGRRERLYRLQMKIAMHTAAAQTVTSDGIVVTAQ